MDGCMERKRKEKEDNLGENKKSRWLRRRGQFVNRQMDQ